LSLNEMPLQVLQAFDSFSSSWLSCTSAWWNTCCICRDNRNCVHCVYILRGMWKRNSIL